MKQLDPCDIALPLNELLDEMLPGIDEPERTRQWNATRVLAKASVITAIPETCGDGRHRRYDPLWIALGRTLLTLKDHYRVHSDVLAEVGRYLWTKRSMIVNCPDPVLYYGAFCNEGCEDGPMAFELVSSAVPKNFMHPSVDRNGKLPPKALHHLAVAIDLRRAIARDPSLIERHGGPNSSTERDVLSHES